MIPERPTPLTLGYGGLLITISISDADPHTVLVETKALDNISRAIVRSYQRVYCRAVAIKADLPNAPRLWLSNTVVELDTDDHITRASAWVLAYAEWIAAGELRGAA